MARIRTIKPEFWTDTFMVQLPHLARLFYIALWTEADDHGFIRDEPERIAMEVMPKEDPMLIDDMIQLFISAGRIETYVTEDGKSFLRVSSWENHQRVDKPSISKIFREDSRKVAIPSETRRMVAEKYGCSPGTEKEVECFYCGTPGLIHWHKLISGRPSAWISFPGLELDHVKSEDSGGESIPSNIVLSCRSCNRSKGTMEWEKALMAVSNKPKPFASVREPSHQEGKGTGNREQGSMEKEREHKGARKPRRVFVKPSLQEVDNFCLESGIVIDTGEWMDHYESNGWMVGTTPLKDWRASIRNWERRKKSFGSKEEQDLSPEGIRRRIKEIEEEQNT